MTTHFTFFESYYDSVEKLDSSTKGEFFDVLFKYALRGELPQSDTNPIVFALFTMAKPNIDKSLAKQLSGKAGGEKSKAGGNQNASKTKQTESENEAKPSNSEKKQSDKEKGIGIGVGVFKAPTLEQVSEYVSMNQYSVNADTFYHYYESIGWKVGNKPMKSWTSALAQWNSKEQKPVNVKSYSKVDIEAGYL